LGLSELPGSLSQLLQAASNPTKETTAVIGWTELGVGHRALLDDVTGGDWYSRHGIVICGATVGLNQSPRKTGHRTGGSK
jgi:hypothetical protein